MTSLAVIREVGRRIAPAWPLDRLVAVNPYAGLCDRSFVDATALLHEVSGARSAMSLPQLRVLWENDAFKEEDVEAALAEMKSDLTPAELYSWLQDKQTEVQMQASTQPTVCTVADVVDAQLDTCWSSFLVEHLGCFCASHFDAGYAHWRPPQDTPIFTAWKEEAEVDRTLELWGAPGFRAAIRALPDSPEDAVSQVLHALRIPEDAQEKYLHRLAMRMLGWSSYISQLVWDQQRFGRVDDDVMVQWFAVLLAFEYGLYCSLVRGPLDKQWQQCIQRFAELTRCPQTMKSHVQYVALQSALEHSFRRQLAQKLQSAPENIHSIRDTSLPPSSRTRRPLFQAVFCIDVRSEIIRRHLEHVLVDIETIGFAGFFGFPFEYVPLGHRRGHAQCPVLVTPTHRIHGWVTDQAGHDTSEQSIREQNLRLQNESTWDLFQKGPISSFGFVSPFGLFYLPKLIFGASAPRVRQDKRFLEKPRMTSEGNTEPATGIPLADRVKLARNALRGMSLQRNLARLIVLTGHGASTANNPHASLLDCGACGGRPGAVNAQVAAAVLNDADVRNALRNENIWIPEDTFFLAALHNTTTDDVWLLNRAEVPESHEAELALLESGFAKASACARNERSKRFLSPEREASAKCAQQIEQPREVNWARRSQDWSEVRPEWGLAGCASFIAAPRHRTRGLDLEGRAFLHSYNWKEDDGFAVLEQILTAPLIVAAWINLQYYASVVDPELFGAGNKTLHNVIGGNLGVWEGGAGDLRIGLPWQSVHDGEKFQHLAVRLHALIEAPTTALNAVIQKHKSIRDLVDHGWIHLLVMNERGQIDGVYAGGLTWRPWGVPNQRKYRL